MDKVRQTQKTFCSRALTLAIAACVILVAAGHVPLGKGLLLGTIFSIINFILMGETLPRRMGKSGRKAFLASLGSIGGRYLLLAVPMIIAIQGDSFDLLFTVIGVFSVQMLILADAVVNLLVSSRGRYNTNN